MHPASWERSNNIKFKYYLQMITSCTWDNYFLNKRWLYLQEIVINMTTFCGSYFLFSLQKNATFSTKSSISLWAVLLLCSIISSEIAYLGPHNKFGRRLFTWICGMTAAIQNLMATYRMYNCLEHLVMDMLDPKVYIQHTQFLRSINIIPKYVLYKLIAIFCLHNDHFLY